MTAPALTLHRHGDIAEIRIERPISAATLDALDATAATLGNDASVRVVLLTSAEPGLFGAVPSSRDDSIRTAPFRALELMPQPVIAAVEGPVAYVGLELILACDIRIASDDAMFGMDYVSIGDIPALGGTQRLPRVVGPTVAAAMILLGQRLTAAEALRCGLVNAVVPAGTMRDEAMRLARAIAARGPLAVRYAKEALIRGADMPLDQALRYETDLTVILQTTADRAEGVAAFLEKRPPHFEGR